MNETWVCCVCVCVCVCVCARARACVCVRARAHARVCVRRDEAPTTISSVLSVFNRSLLLFIHDKTSSVMSECLTGQNKIHPAVHLVRAPYRQHNCESCAHDQKLHPAEAGNKV